MLLNVLSLGSLAILLHPLFGILDVLLDRSLVIGIQLTTQALFVSDLSTEHRNEILVVVHSLNTLADRLILFGELLSLCHHAIDLLLRKATLVICDRNRFAAARTLVGGHDLHDTVGIHFERHFDLRHATRSRRNVVEFKLAEQVVVFRHRTLTLEHLDQHSVLVVSGRTEDLALFGRHHRVTWDQLRHHTTRGLDTERKRVNIDQHHTTERFVT